ncbi:PXA domain-containing protein [Triangularia verruculosa]|uniref:PXA domain-containing protein n=1 Tax=Triangularia verruculosa TaxID=2587418 RepID=A0AAN6XNE1_9PEZI|nr:PXA domain-containing protein [Triangularia verruculosa]
MSQQDAPSSGAIPDSSMADQKHLEPSAVIATEKQALEEPDETTAAAIVAATDDAFPSPPNAPPADDNVSTKVFRFLSTATPETLGGVAVGLAATTYLVLGRLGLVLIGAFGGIVTFIQWEQRNPEVARVVRGERGIDVLARLLETKHEIPEPKEEGAGPQDCVLIRGFEDLRPETRDAMNELVDAIVDNYVKWWYSPIVPVDKFFPLACRKTLTAFLTSASNHLARKRPADAFLDFLTNSSSIVVVFFSELSNAFAELPADSKLSAADAVYNYLAAHPDSNLASLLNQKQQANKFRMISEDLLNFLEHSSYECNPARVFLREILAGVVLEMTLQSFSKPEFINSWIVYLLEAGEPDLNQAIDVGMQTGPDVAFADIDGNVGNIGLTKGNRNSLDQERARRKESLAHRKKLSKAEEEMELAMEEMKRLNQMIANETTLMAESSQSEPKRHEATTTDEMNGLDPQEASKSQATKDFSKSISSDSSSSKNEVINTPVTPLSVTTPSSQTSPTASQNPAVAQTAVPAAAAAGFTSFDQLVPSAQEETETESAVEAAKPPLTVHNANITVLDEPGDKPIKSKPAWDYLVQIEPATTLYPGWMIVRKYSDFEVLHEVLRRIATISGAVTFSQQHNVLPPWKNHTRTSLRIELERYLKDACQHQSLAESEGLRKFMERDNGHLPQPKSGFQAFEKIGKNVLGVLASAPLEGSKAMMDGMTGVLGNIGLVSQKKPAPAPSPPPSALQDVTAASRLSMSTLSRNDSTLSLNRLTTSKTRDSIDSQHSSVLAMQPPKVPPLDRRPSYNSQGGDTEPETTNLRPSRASARNSREQSRTSSRAPARSPSTLSFDGFRLPPPPDMISDDYESPLSPHGQLPEHLAHHSRSLTMPTLSSQRINGPPLTGKQHTKLSEQETRVAVELMFAVINEMYTLSSAWNIRRTLLAAAKSFLLRPGNPSLLSIQTLIQQSVLDVNTADAGIAAHIKKLRQNVMPTEEEKKEWPAEMTAEEKEALRVKARKLLIESGVPAALMGVMGQAATSEALGRLFDCLQIEEVARGLMFGVVLQAVRTVTH